MDMMYYDYFACFNNGNGRNSEKRRERSKVAARCRRSKESEIFSELCDFLPLPESTRNSLDKASIMRLSLSDLKLRHMMENVFGKEMREDFLKLDYESREEMRLELDSCMSNAMGGFLIVVSTDGDIVYVTESVTTHLGLSQVELMGYSVYDFSHPCDHADIKDLLVKKKKDEDEDTGNREGSFRMKCTITSRGRNVHLRAATYKVIEFTGRMFETNENNQDKQWFVGIGEPLFHPSDVDIPLNKQIFLTKHSPDMKYTFADDSVLSFLGYAPEDVVGKSIFEFFHASDGPAMAKAFKSLYSKGQAVTERYRFLAKNGGWVWVVTQATVIQGPNGTKPNSVVCLNFVISGIENENEILSAVQTLSGKASAVVPVYEKAIEEPVVEKENIAPIVLEPAEPITSTKDVIAPRTKDMDSGFLMPCDNTLIVSKEEPEDLTHLAPIAGDACVPLDMPVPILDNLLKELEAAQVPFTLNECELDLNLDNYAFTKTTGDSAEEKSISSPQEHEMCKDPASAASSPLFLHSDPMVMSPGSTSSLLSPFQMSPSLSGHRNSDSSRYMSDFSSPSSSMPELSPASYRYSGDEANSPPGVCALTLEEEAFNPVMIDSSPANLSEMQCSLPGFHDTAEKSVAPDPPPAPIGTALNGAFIILPDGRKFPVMITSNLNQIVCQLDANAEKRDIQPFLDKGKPDLVEPFGGEQKISPPHNMNKNMCNTPSSFSITNRPLNVDLNSPILRGSALPSIAEALFRGDTGPPLAKTPRMTSEMLLGANPSPSMQTPFRDASAANRYSLDPPNVNPIFNRTNLPFKAEMHELSNPVDPPWSNHNKISNVQGVRLGQTNVDVMAHLNQLMESGRVDEVRNILKTHQHIRSRVGTPRTDVDFHQTDPDFLSSGSRKRDISGAVLNESSRGSVRLDATQFPNLYELTRRDCEVNAPLSGNSSLLAGKDLLMALDTSVDPFA